MSWDPVAEIISRLKGVVPTSDGYEAFCPLHEADGERGGHKPSLAITRGHDGRALVKCRVGCKTVSVVHETGMTMGQLFPNWGQKENRDGKSRKALGTIVATYDYVDEHGTLLYQACRMEPKDFRQRAADGTWKTKGIRKVLYRLPELLAADSSEPVFMAEGEKDVDNVVALGLTATCNVGGAGKFQKQIAEPLTGHPIVLLEDNDAAGRAHVQDVASKLKGKVPSIKVVRFQDLPEKGDISDWITNGGTKEQLLEMVAAAPEWEPEPVDPNTDGAGGLELFDDGFTIANAIVVKSENETVTTPICMELIVDRIRKRTGGQPYRVGTALFAHQAGGEPEWLPSTPAMFGWLGSTCPPPARFKSALGCHSREEVFAEFQRTSKAFLAVETLPHEPPFADHYYCCTTPEPGDGQALKGLINRFSPAEQIDRDLLTAMFVTPGWGGRGGSRPAFTITSEDGRGAGKTAAASMLAHLWQGVLELSANENAEIMKQRLLSPVGLTRRIALLDNVKTMRFSWAELESLITAETISGKRMYVGEGVRPNNLTWVITLNGASYSTDMAQRSVFVKIRKPKHSGNWADDTKAYIDEHRSELIADVIGFLRSERAPLSQYSRWGAWERDILSRLPDPTGAQRTILERQNVADVELEESDIVEDYFRQQLTALHYSPDVDRVFLPSLVVCHWFNQATNEKHTSTSVSRTINQKINERKFHALAENKCKTWGRGFVWVGSEWSGEADTKTDVETRLDEMKRNTDRRSF